MNKAILIFLGLFSWATIQAQVSFLSEDFEGTTVSLTSSSNSTSAWATNTTLYSQGVKSNLISYGQNDTVYLTSPSFDASGSSVVFLEFDQICKIEFFDKAIVEVSSDNGSTWTALTASQYMGQGTYYLNGFNEVTHMLWDPGFNSSPTNQWWKTEKFEITSLVSTSTQAKIRFTIIDLNNTGVNGKYGWLLDNIKVWKPGLQEAMAVDYNLPLVLSSSCGLGNEVVELKIANVGSAGINGNLTASFQREGMAAVTETVSTPISFKDTIIYTFTNTIDLSTTTDTSYNIKVWVNLTGDPNQTNDTIFDNVISRFALPLPQINDTTIPYATSVTLHAIHSDTVQWFSDPLGINRTEYGKYLTTPILYDTAYYYAQAGIVSLDDITTTMAGGYNDEGNMFDIQAINTIHIDSFYVHGITDDTVQVWYRSGSYVGHTSSNVGWVLLGQDTLSNTGPGAQTPLRVGGLTIPAGQTYGIYITYKSQNSMSYTVGNGTNENYQDNNMKIMCGHGGNYFNLVNSPRVWNGKIFYHAGGMGAAGSCPSAVKKVTVNVSGIPQNDAALVDITPTGTANIGSTSPFMVELKNSGIDTLEKCNIFFSINDSLYAPYAWTGSLLRDSSIWVNLSNITFSSSIYQLKAWTSQPNDSLDWANHNDTINSLVSVCLSGTFTLGNATADFLNFTDFITILDSVGICGNTTINILPGLYTEQWEIGTIKGATSSIGLTLQSSTGNPADVIIQYTPTVATAKHVIRLTGTENITIKHLTVKALGTTYGQTIEITSGSRYITLDSNLFSTEDLANGRVITIQGGASSRDILVSNNQVTGGKYSVYAYATSGDKGNYTTFINNNFEGFMLYSVYAYYIKRIEFINNKFRNHPTANNAYVFRMTQCDGLNISGNDILLNGARGNWGAYLYNCDSLPGRRSLFANNMIITTTGYNPHYGLIHYKGNGMDIVNNSFFNQNGNSSNMIIRLYNSTNSYADNSLYNNSIYNTGSGYNIYVYNNGRLRGADNNNIYGPSATNFAYWESNRASLSALKTAFPTNNQNSISVNPQYVSTTDLHTNSFALNGAGRQIHDLIPTDFDGEYRDSLTPDIGADEYILIANDAGLISMEGPIVGCAGSSLDVKVKIKSFGFDTLTTCTINWSIDGVMKTPVIVTDTLVFHQTKDILLGSESFSTGTTHTLKFWTSLPNNTTDLNPYNDTIVGYFKTGLPAGTYTIGGNNPDFATFVDAADEMNNYGICGPIVFNVASGTYNEQFELSKIFGSSTTNTITFQSASADSSDVILNHNSISTATNYVVSLNGAANVIFKNMTLQSSGNTFTKVILLQNRTNNLEFSHCVIRNTYAVSGSVPDDDRNLIYTLDTLGHNFSIHDCYIKNGNVAISLNGGLAPKTGWNISNNIFSTNAFGSVHIKISSGSKVENNIFTNNSVVMNDYKAISISQSSDSLHIMNNKITLGASGTCQALSVVTSHGDSLYPILIANNFISLNQSAISGSATAIQANASKHINVYHNNVSLKGNYANTSAFEVSNTLNTETRNLNIKNNIFASSIPGSSIYSFTNCLYSGFTNDYNNLYLANSGSISGNINSLSAWRTASGDASHSMDIDPYYPSANDLHVFNNLLNGAAFPIPEITNDIDGETRSTTTPDIGADEFTPSPYDVTVLAILSPTNGCMLDSNETVTILVKNTGSANIISGLSLAYRLSPLSSPVIENVTGTFASGDSLTYSFIAKADFDVSSFGDDSVFTLKAWCTYANDLIKANDTAVSYIGSYYTPNAPVATDVTGNYGQPGTLTATGTHTLKWYNTLTSSTILGTGSSYQTPLLFDTTSYWVSSAATHCESARTKATVNVVGFPAVDAGISGIVSPNTDVAYKSSQTLKAELHNYGTSNLTSSKVYWTLNGQLDSLNWTGNISGGAVDTITLNTIFFDAGTYDLRAWTSMPNSVVDPSNTNDTSSIFNFRACLSGNYTIGDTTNGAVYDFPTFNSAEDALIAGGICGPVTFLVDSGMYEEKLNLLPIVGASSTSRITFTSLSGDSTDVTLHYTLTPLQAWTMRFNGFYYTFSHMTLSSLGGNTYGRVIEIANGAQHNVISNCVIEGTITTSASANYSVIYSNGGNNRYNTIKNNLILNGSYALYFTGGSSNKQKGIVIKDNIIKDFFYYGPCFYYQNDLVFSGNYVENSPSASVYGLRLRYCEDYEISKNTINVTGTSAHRGMYIYYCDGSVTETNLVANNMVSVSGASGSTGYGIYGYNNDYVNFYNNSILQLSGGSSVSSFYQYSGSFQNVVNNIFVNKGGGYAYYMGTPSAIVTSDYNNLYATGSKVAYAQGGKNNLSLLQASTGKDANSKSVDPMFFSNTDLHTASYDMNGAGTVIPIIAEDIDGDPRSPYAPDMGADEFVFPQNDAHLVKLNSPGTMAIGNTNIWVTVQNEGSDSLKSVDIAWEVNTIAQTSYSWTGALAYGESDSVNIGSFNFNQGTNYLKAWVHSPNNQIDGNNQNDTILETIVGCVGPMRGVYTIGGANADYNNINDALIQLYNCSLDSHVVFNIASGTYSGQIEIHPIAGTTDTATVTFQSAALDSTTVILTHNSNSVDNYTVYLNSADWIQFKHLSIVASNSSAGRALVINNGATYNTFENCIIQAGPGTANTCVAIYSGDDLDNNNTFRRNRILDGYYGVYMEGESLSLLESGTVFEYNEIIGYHNTGFYYEYADNLVFNHNTIANGASSSYGTGLFLDHADGDMEISFNHIKLQTSGYSIAMELNDCDADSSNPSKIYNNFFSVVTNNGSSKALKLEDCSYQYYTNNNLYVSSASSYARCADILGGNDNKLLNNNMMISGSGYIYYISDATSVNESNYNNLYSSGGQFVQYVSQAYSDPSNMYAASGLEANTVSIDPGYKSNSDLHISTVQLNAIATTLSWVTHDFDNELRSTTPDIGADEFTPPALDLAVVGFVNPTGFYNSIGTLQNVGVTIKNLGADTIHAVSLVYTYGSGASVSQAWTGSLNPSATTNVQFNTPITTLAGTETICVVGTLTGDTIPHNDTFCMTMKGLQTLTPPVCDDFDSVNLWVSADPLWQLGTPQSSSIYTAHSGSNAWMTNLTSDYPNGADDYLYSPYYDFSNVVYGSIMKFWRNNMFASNDGFNVEFTDDGGATWTTLGLWGDTLGTNWYTGQYNGSHYFLSASNGWEQSMYRLDQFNLNPTPIQFRFHMVSTSSVTNEGVAIDDFCIELVEFPHDAGVVSIDAPILSTQIGSMNNLVTITVKNSGTATQTSIPVNYKVGTSAVVSETMTIASGLAPDSSAQFTFTQPFTSLAVNSYNLCAFTSLTGDFSTTNDTACTSLSTTPAATDAGVSKVLAPDSITSIGATNVVKIRIVNYGTDPMSSCDIQYIVNSGTPVVETWSGSALALGDSVDYTFTTTFNSPLGAFLLCAKTLLPNDVNNTNDESCSSHIASGLDEHTLNGMKLYQNVPNPTNGNCYIKYEIPTAGNVRFTVTNALGQNLILIEESATPGTHQVDLNETQLAPGIYYYSIEFDNYMITKKLIISK